MTDARDSDAAMLAGSIIGAEKRPVHARDSADQPNPVGGFANALYRVRGYILIAALLLTPVLVLVSLLT